MQRVWRSKANKELIKLMEESVDIKLYLIQEKGPLSFVFQDDTMKKYLINIGDNISCSCGGGKKEHCVHTIYVLNRIFKINFNDPLILQLNYSDAELGNMISFRNQNPKDVKKNRKKINNNPDISDEEIEELKPNNSPKRNLVDDPTCSICQEDMYTKEGLFTCSNSCGHNFHLNCLKVWADHKKATSDLISCPMCRSEWEEETLKKGIIKISHEKNFLKVHRGVSCSNCSRANIKGERFHCLICENFDMCIECFNLNKHHKSHSLIIKKSVDDKWLGLEYNTSITNNEKYTIKNILFSQFLISLLKDYDKTKKIEIKEENKENIQDENEVISNNDKKCTVCKSGRESSMQLLKFKEFIQCAHLIHFKCSDYIFKVFNEVNGSNYLVDSNFNKCKFDNKDIFPGLSSLKFKIREIEIGNVSQINNDTRMKVMQKQIFNNIKNNNNFTKIRGDNNQVNNEFLIINSINVQNYGTNNNNVNNNKIGINNLLKHKQFGISRKNNHTINSYKMPLLDLAINIEKMDFSNNNKNNYDNEFVKKEPLKRKINSVKPRTRIKIDENKNKIMETVIVNSILPHIQNDINKIENQKSLRVVNLNRMELKLSPLMSNK